VTKVTTTKTQYEVVAEDTKKAEDAVYWRDSSERETIDAHRVAVLSTETTYEVAESSEPLTDACGHLHSQHGRDGCGWDGCDCKQSGPAGFISEGRS